ncbi:TPA: hypothetical protein ACX6R8_003763 [Photobacterium damselae]
MQTVKMRVGGVKHRRPLFQRRGLNEQGQRVMKYYARTKDRKYAYLFEVQLKQIGTTKTRKALIKHAKATA